MNDKYMRVFLNVTNIGLSDFTGIPKAVSKPISSSFVQTTDWIVTDAMASIEAEDASLAEKEAANGGNQSSTSNQTTTSETNQTATSETNQTVTAETNQTAAAETNQTAAAN